MNNRLLSLDANFSVICRNSAQGCCTCSLKTYRLTAYNVDRRLIFFLRQMPVFVSKGDAVRKF